MIDTTLHAAIRRNNPLNLVRFTSLPSMQAHKVSDHSKARRIRGHSCVTFTPRPQPSTQVSGREQGTSTCCASSAVGAKISTRGLPGLALPCTSASSSNLSCHMQQSTSKKAIFNNPVITARTWMESWESMSLDAFIPGNTAIHRNEQENDTKITEATTTNKHG